MRVRDYLGTAGRDLFMGAMGREKVILGGRTLEIQKQIAEGGFSIVYLVKQTSGADRGQVYALKTVICQNAEQVKAAEHERQVHVLCAHPNVLPLVDYALIKRENRQHQEALYLFPFVAGGTVFDLVSAIGPLPAEQVPRLFGSICEGVCKMHSVGLRHNDLKPHNVLLDCDQALRLWKVAQPIVMDLGSASPLKTVIASRMGALMLQDKASVESSAPYRAPELFQVPYDCVIDGKVDVWALGGLVVVQYQ
jgi:serine/threonine kinase 16